MKLLKIEGVKEIIVIGCDIRCPLNGLNVKCKLDESIDVEKHHYGEFPADCPLPEYVNENEHTAPDGTELVAMEPTEKTSFDSCRICHYFNHETIECMRIRDEPSCRKPNRNDKRSIGWVKKSEVK